MRLNITAAATGPLRVITYLVACEDSGEALLIDPGGPSAELSAKLRHEKLAAALDRQHPRPCRPYRRQRPLGRATGARIVIHRLDWEFFRTPEMQAAARAEGFPPLTRADVLVDDGHRHPPGGLPGPGPPHPGPYPRRHLPLFPRPSVHRGHPVRGRRRPHRPAGGSLTQLIASLEEKIMPLPDDTRIWPGHDYGETPTSTLGEEKAHQPLSHRFFLTVPVNRHPGGLI